MKQLRFANIFYSLPLFFFVLTGSPNLNGERIGHTLGVVILLFLVVGYLNFRQAGRKSRQWIDLMVSLLVLCAAYTAMAVNVFYASLIIIWPLLFLLKFSGRPAAVLLQLLKAFLLFSLLYFGINQYDFENLTKLRVAWMMLVFVFQFLFIATQFKWQKQFALNRELGLSWLVAILSLALYSGLQFALNYSLILLLISLPGFIMLLRLATTTERTRQLRQVVIFRIVSIGGLIVFNFYLFLDVTQVLQAVMGGY